MKNSIRLVAVAASVAAISLSSFAQVTQTLVSDGVVSQAYGALGAAPGPLFTPLSVSTGTFTGGVLTSGFTNNGVLGTNSLLGDTAVTGDLSVSGTTSTNGIDNGGQVISNVAAGVAASDASTVGQLNAASAAQAAVNANQAAINTNQAAFNNQMLAQTDSNRRIASTGTAIVAAAASIPALEAGKNMGLGVGVGGYDGRSAVSVALAARASERLQFKLHVGTGSGGKVAAGAGGMWSW